MAFLTGSTSATSSSAWPAGTARGSPSARTATARGTWPTCALPWQRPGEAGSRPTRSSTRCRRRGCPGSAPRAARRDDAAGTRRGRGGCGGRRGAAGWTAVRGAAAPSGGLLPPPGARGGTRPARPAAGPRRAGGPRSRAAGRGGGVRRLRQGPGQPRLPGRDQPQRGDVRPARTPVRLFHLRHALLRERGLRPAWRGPGRAAASGAAGARRRADGRSPARQPSWRPAPRPRPRDRGAGPRRLARGPARVTEALGLAAWANGAGLRAGPVWLAEGGPVADAEVAWTGRVGVSTGADRPWRVLVAGSPYVSGGRPGPPAKRRRRPP